MRAPCLGEKVQATEKLSLQLFEVDEVVKDQKTGNFL